MRENISKLSDDKLHKGIVIGQQIHNIAADKLFERLLTEAEKSALLKLMVFALNLTGILRPKIINNIVKEFFIAYQTLDVIYNVFNLILIFYIYTSASSLGSWAQ
jgi:hypothetical protein